MTEFESEVRMFLNEINQYVPNDFPAIVVNTFCWIQDIKPDSAGREKCKEHFLFKTSDLDEELFCCPKYIVIEDWNNISYVFTR